MRPKHIPGHTGNTRIGAVQVNMVDYKFGEGLSDDDLQESREATRRLVLSLYEHTNFIQRGKDKVTADIELKSGEIGTRLPLNFHLGKRNDLYIKPFDLPLPQQYRGKTVANLHEALSRMSRVDPGGNVPNMVRNITHIMGTKIIPEDMELQLYSSDEPLFQQWYESLSTEVRERIRYTGLSVPSRKGLHLSYAKGEGKFGTLGIGTPSHSTIHEMEPHFGDLLSCNHVLVSESLEHHVKTPDARRKYRELHNPSTAFREQSAIESYNHVLNGGEYIPIVSLNDEEIVDYIESIIKRQDSPASLSSEATPKETLSFESPFDQNGNLNGANIAIVDESIQRYFSCITPREEGTLNFPLCVSCGAKGGYHVACTVKGKKFVIFSTTPNEEGAKKILNIVGNNDDVRLSHQKVMGAGDSVATILSLSHIWDIPAYMNMHAKKNHPSDAKFIEVASMIFISLLSRCSGEILYHSLGCDWRSVPHGAFEHLVENAAKKSLEQAGNMWRNVARPHTVRESDWGIDIAMWELT